MHRSCSSAACEAKKSNIRKELQQAVAEERYEDAAAIRDRLGRPEDVGKPSA
ncbi:MAG TPA: hypothetical protein ENH84_02600 [Phycisphaerae bacterium]|nr:hypothetical protein [Phycisphaerae bacterium]